MENKDIQQLAFIEPADIAKQVYKFYPDADPEKKSTMIDVNFRCAYINLVARCLRGRYNVEEILKSMGLAPKSYYYYVNRHNKKMKSDEHYRVRVIKGSYLYLYALNNKRKQSYERQLEKAKQNGGEW